MPRQPPKGRCPDNSEMTDSVPHYGSQSINGRKYDSWGTALVVFVFVALPAGRSSDAITSQRSLKTEVDVNSAHAYPNTDNCIKELKLARKFCVS